MNTCLIKSGVFFLRGSILLSIGYVSGNRRLCATGHQMQTNARCQLVIGSAQKIIKQYIKRQAAMSAATHS